MTTAAEIIDCLMAMADEGQAKHLMRFFKTGKGQYGEGDKFIGLKVPQTRMVMKEARLDVPFIPPGRKGGLQGSSCSSKK